ncbi:MAG: CYTH domain protein [candidate division WS6 bacterium OLB20]|uniref:CYTH domain protein n=1 Tax=candidate division WS6 bacterium OLB20 TaxID=1617426 RepID=A0A136LZ42_9BACT|nr:MAG: CYTH domain protein [candidate division WS6 bacterium OLB20]
MTVNPAEMETHNPGKEAREQVMATEFEATFMIASKDDARQRLSGAGATLKYPEYLQTRAVFDLPEGNEIPHGWLRVRREQDRITLSLKVVENNTGISGQREIELTVNDFDAASALLQTIGCKLKALQDNLREAWDLDGVVITIDEWPFLEPFIEIEGESEEAVILAAEALGYDYSGAYFGAVDGMYAAKYGIPEDIINNHTPEIRFGMQNPFTPEEGAEE